MKLALLEGAYVLVIWIASGMVFSLTVPPLPRGTKLEIRRCHPVANEDESQRSLTCSCKVADWIRDGSGQIVVCEEEEEEK